MTTRARQVSASMSETDPDRLGLLPDRRLGSFHRLRDLHYRSPRFRVRLEVTQIFLGPWFPNRRLFFGMIPLRLDRPIVTIVAQQNRLAQGLSRERRVLAKRWGK